jgi:hypothetical protein
MSSEVRWLEALGAQEGVDEIRHEDAHGEDA